MSLRQADALTKLAPILARSAWDFGTLLDLSAYGEAIRDGRRNQELLTADAVLNDAYWRILALVDPFRLPVKQRHFAFLYRIVKGVLVQELKILPDEASGPAKAIARFLASELLSLDARGQRPPLDRGIREMLILRSGGPVRCWYCGYHFSDDQVAGFVEGSQPTLMMPRYVDFVAPKCVPADMRIEIDHIVPVGAGGRGTADNLRISCGWCNRYKSSLSAIYDAPSVPIAFRHPRLGELLMPVPFWIIRVRATRRRCESPEGCVADIDTEPLVVGPVRQEGGMVPGNLGVYCYMHDPWGGDRLIPRQYVMRSRNGLLSK